jgi:hypothetical protein
MTLPCAVGLDLQAGTYRLGQLPDATPAHVRGQAEAKARKLVAFLAEHIRLRDTDLERPVTAGDLEKRGDEARAERIRAYCAANSLSYERDPMFGNDHFTIGGQRMSAPEVAARLIPDLFTAPQPARADAGPELDL